MNSIQNTVCCIRCRKKCRLYSYYKVIFICLIATSSVIFCLLALHVRRPAVVLFYSCFDSANTSAGVSASNYAAFLQGHYCKHNFSDSVLDKHVKLDLEGDDILVQLHIQKTGGASFDRNLVHNLDVRFPCRCVPGIKKCDCLTKNKKHWLFSRYATGWICGLHADWTEMTGCLEQWFKRIDPKSRKHRRYHYITLLRNPVQRFLSEWKHVQRGATWKSARLHCNGKSASLEDIPFCYKGVSWSGVSLEEFLSCKHNLAFNRMTRMLANLSKVNCYNHTGFSQEQVDRILIQSAKENLLDFAFVGILEEQRKSQFLFENNLGLKFIKKFRQNNETHASSVELSEEVMSRILERNHLDIELYQFAKDLFLQRVSYTERTMGHSVREYFSHVRKAQDSFVIANENVKEFHHEDQYDTEEDDDIVEVDNFYPSKSYIHRVR